MQKMIKHLLYTWYEEVDDPTSPDPSHTVLRERIARLGQVADITRDADVVRGERLGSFYTDEEREAIEDGTYRGFDAESVYGARGGVKPVPQISSVDGEHGGVDTMDAAELAEYIKSEGLNVQGTLALAGDTADPELIQKVIDAENIATGNDPRTGVVEPLEKKLLALGD